MTSKLKSAMCVGAEHVQYTGLKLGRFVNGVMFKGSLLFPGCRKGGLRLGYLEQKRCDFVHKVARELLSLESHA